MLLYWGGGGGGGWGGGGGGGWVGGRGGEKGGALESSLYHQGGTKRRESLLKGEEGGFQSEKGISQEKGTKSLSLPKSRKNA